MDELNEDERAAVGLVRSPRGGKGPFRFGPAKEDIIGFGHAASRSRAERYTHACGRRWSPDQRLGSLDLQLRRKPRPPQYSGLCPCGGSEVKPRVKMLGECRQQRIPPLVTNEPWLLAQQPGLLPPVLLEELPPLLCGGCSSCSRLVAPGSTTTVISTGAASGLLVLCCSGWTGSRGGTTIRHTRLQYRRHIR
jgi:hypothetical protein